MHVRLGDQGHARILVDLREEARFVILVVCLGHRLLPSLRRAHLGLRTMMVVLSAVGGELRLVQLFESPFEVGLEELLMLLELPVGQALLCVRCRHDAGIVAALVCLIVGRLAQVKFSRLVRRIHFACRHRLLLKLVVLIFSSCVRAETNLVLVSVGAGIGLIMKRIV